LSAEHGRRRPGFLRGGQTHWPYLVEGFGSPADTDEVIATLPTHGRPRSKIKELLARSDGIPADRVTDGRPGTVSWEAKDGRCGEIFNPGPMDVTHNVGEDERTECGGQGEIIGGWS
jgi:hypothetical protein